MMSEASKAFQQGDLASARRLLQAQENIRPAQMEMLAAIAILEGKYDDAIGNLGSLLPHSRANQLRRHRIKRRLSLVYFHTNQYDLAAALGLGDPLTKLMRHFGGEPNVIDWSGQSLVRLPFRQDTEWELPQVELTINGERLEAKIDTGGDLLSVPWALAGSLGLEAAATSTGRFAGGDKAKIGWGRAEHVELGDVAIANVPISLNGMAHPVVGTGLLRLFQSTLDYPGHRLLLRPRGSRPIGGVPFLLAGTHLMIVDGSIAGVPTKLLVDSGLEADNDASFLASEPVMRQAGIPTPATVRSTGNSGAGTTHLDIGAFSVAEVTLGATTRTNLTGLTGIFPQQLAKPRTLGFPLGGLVSHNFLRHYQWTLDFGQMRMTLEQPRAAS